MHFVTQWTGHQNRPPRGVRPVRPTAARDSSRLVVTDQKICGCSASVVLILKLTCFRDVEVLHMVTRTESP